MRNGCSLPDLRSRDSISNLPVGTTSKIWAVSPPPPQRRSRPRPVVLIISLPNSVIVGAVLEQIKTSLNAGAILVDTTTGEPDEMARFGRDLAGRGIGYLDATVGGSSTQVRAGDAIVMCGGERDGFERCQDLFRSFSRRAFHIGPCGSGARMKLVLNLVLGLNRAVLAEGLGFASANGIGAELALEILKASPAYSRVMDTKGAKIIGGEFTPEARLSQHLKDVRLILKAGKTHGAFLPLSTLHDELLSRAEEEGYGALDNSAIALLFLNPDKH